MNELPGRGGKRPGAGRPRIQIVPSKRPVLPPQVSVDELEILCQMGATVEEIAAFFHITIRPLQKLIKAHPELKEVMKAGRLRGNVGLLQNIYKRIPKSDMIMALVAKNRFGWNDKSNVVHSGPNGNPIEVKTTVQYSTELLDAVLRDFEKRKLTENPD